jgi:hypothetical protein
MQVWILQKFILILTARRCQKLSIGYRQGYGQLYNLKVDDREIDSDDLPADDISNYLEYKDEEPEVVANKYIKDMIEKYRDYKKISILKRKMSK